MRQIDNYLWRVLAVIGLTFLNCKLGPKGKFFRLLFMICLAASVSNISIITLYLFKIQRYKLAIVTSSLGIYPALMWYIAYSKKKAMHEVIFQVYQQRNYCNTSKETLSYIVIFFVFFTIAMPCVSYISTNYHIRKFLMRH